MSANTVETILSRAMSDAAFAEQLFADPDAALAGYDLTAGEIAQLKGMPRSQFAALAPEERISFATSGAGAGRINHNETALKA